MRLEKKPQRPKPQSRLFLAFDLPLDLKRQLHANNRIFNKENRNFNFVTPEQMHLTIKFLGNNVSSKSMIKIIEAVNDVIKDVYPMSLEINSLRFGFPHQTIPKIIFYNILPTVELDNLYKAIGYRIKKLELSDILATSFIKKEVYHLTVARLKHQPNRGFGRKIRTIIKEFEFEPISFPVNEFWLMESVLDKSNTPKYSFIHKFNLK